MGKHHIYSSKSERSASNLVAVVARRLHLPRLEFVIFILLGFTLFVQIRPEIGIAWAFWDILAKIFSRC